MKRISIDIETYSDVDLIRCGVYKYVNSPNFEILLIAYSIDDEEVKVVDICSGENLSNEIRTALMSPEVIKTAYNAQFERVCLSRYFGLHEYINPQSWYCTMIQSAELSLPSSLADVGATLGLERQKMMEGKELIKYFCVPCKPTKINGGRTRNMPADSPDKWKIFKEYCKRDVDAELQIARKLKKYPISEAEHALYVLDQNINDRGVLVDLELARQAVKMNNVQTAIATEQAYSLTGLENPNSVAQLKSWLVRNGVEIESLSKKAVAELAKETDGDISEMLRLRLLMSKTSVKKYEAVIRSVCNDGRVRGMMRFYGANRTGRWSGNILQPQNLPRNYITDLTLARDVVKDGDFDLLDLAYGNVPNVLSELIRTVLVPKECCRFIVADFSAIEARVLAWMAGEQWRLDTFKKGGDIYCASASKMFHVPVEKHGINGELRQKGKISELACGYGGGVGALKSMGAVEMGVPEDELQGLINDWRSANPHIVQFWYEVGMAAMKAIKEKTTISLGRLAFIYESGVLFIRLPNGRRLAYIKPHIGTNRFGGESITYMGISTLKKWERIETFGGKLVENITQGIARDLLASAMLNVTNAGYNIVFHVHDEIIAEMPNGKGSVDEMCQLMSINPDWAQEIPLTADGYECEYYRKD
jgi:DNA polymerase|nr:MAG TPA: DNA polymerase I [Caudoviricetes sp.]